MQGIKISLFKNIKSTKPLKEVNIWEWLLIEQKDLSKVKRIRKTNDLDEVKWLKSTIACITPSGIFNKRNTAGLKEHSGLICIDIDGKDNLHIQNIELLKYEIGKKSFIAYCGLSVSGKGLFCLIPILNPLQHKEHFYAIQEDFNSIGIRIDNACSDVCRLRAYSIDENPIINLEAVAYSKTKEQEIVSHGNVKSSIEFKQNQADSFSSKLLNYSLENIVVIPSSCKSQILDLIIKIELKQIDITRQYKDWFAICCILVNQYGENGRGLFHRVSQFYPNYNFIECEVLYSSCLQKPYRYRVAQFSEIANRHGLF